LPSLSSHGYRYTFPASCDEIGDSLIIQEATPADALLKDPPSTKVCFFLMHKQNNPSLVTIHQSLLIFDAQTE
jgi:hypothetical protein